MAKPTVTVKVQMLVEITTDTWDADVSYNQIKDESAKVAKSFLANIAHNHSNKRMTIIGEPSAVSVTMTADPREKP